jgi:hypothetical protein
MHLNDAGLKSPDLTTPNLARQKESSYKDNSSYLPFARLQQFSLQEGSL